MLELGVNIDHVATLRQVRRGIEPDPVLAAIECEQAGADSITVHLREDRRHIQDQDVKRIKKILNIKLNLEMAATQAMVQFALKIRPNQVTFVPERRQELTTEGGLDLNHNPKNLRSAIDLLESNHISVSLFVDPSKKSVLVSRALGVRFIELHTGTFVNSKPNQKKKTLQDLIDAAVLAHQLGLTVHAGHGINYENIFNILKIPFLQELNIGHSIVARSIFTGMKKAVQEMLTCMHTYKG